MIVPSLVLWLVHLEASQKKFFVSTEEVDDEESFEKLNFFMAACYSSCEKPEMPDGNWSLYPKTQNTSPLYLKMEFALSFISLRRL